MNSGKEGGRFIYPNLYNEFLSLVKVEFDVPCSVLHGNTESPFIRIGRCDA